MYNTFRENLKIFNNLVWNFYFLSILGLKYLFRFSQNIKYTV